MNLNETFFGPIQQKIQCSTMKNHGKQHNCVLKNTLNLKVPSNFSTLNT